MSKATVLLVDDNPTNLHLLIDQLQKSDYKLLIAPSGEQALQQTERIAPDLILLDVMMPGIDGFETCRRLKENAATKDIPVIFMTALTETVDKLKGFTVGGVDYITKPFQSEEVFARVETHVTLRSLQKRLEEKNAQLQAEIARRMQAEAELQESNQQLEAANASKDKFFSIIAHDLRSPFNWLIGLTQIIVENIETYQKDKIKDMLTRLHASTETVYALLTNLLAWSRLQRGHLEYAPAEIALAPLAAQNIHLLAAVAEQKQITLTSRIPEGLAAYADQNMVDAVLRNLLSNAVKFTPAGGTVSVSAQANENAVEMAVIDTGVGIDAEDLAKLFRIDVKYTNIGTAGERGSGLGLILCKELIEKHGGALRVESAVGQGTAFRLTLPQKSTSSDHK